MKIYTYSQAREKLADILEESKREEVIIRRSPFEVAGLQKSISRKEILEAIHESRERA